jgi:hypothetical protein
VPHGTLKGNRKGTRHRENSNFERPCRARGCRRQEKTRKRRRYLHRSRKDVAFWVKEKYLTKKRERKKGDALAWKTENLVEKKTYSGLKIYWISTIKRIYVEIQNIRHYRVLAIGHRLNIVVELASSLSFPLPLPHFLRLYISRRM